MEVWTNGFEDLKCGSCYVKGAWTVKGVAGPRTLLLCKSCGMERTIVKFDDIDPATGLLIGQQMISMGGNTLNAPPIEHPIAPKSHLNKTRGCELLPPLAILKVAEVMQDGMAQHPGEPWRTITVEEHLGKMIGHILKHLNGQMEENHLSLAATRGLMALERSLQEKT